MCDVPCIYEANVRALPVRVHLLEYNFHATRQRSRTFDPWFSCTLAVVCDILILGQRVLKILVRVAVITLKPREAILFIKTSNLKNLFLVAILKKCVGGP
jgi:hypothetical protein